MSPRAYIPGTGLPAGQDPFPESAKAIARHIALKQGAAQVWRNFKEEDGGGNYKDKWEKVGSPWDGRVDALGRKEGQKVAAEQVTEATTHFITLEPKADVTVEDRVEIEGRMFTLTGELVYTNEATIRMQAKELFT